MEESKAEEIFLGEGETDRERERETNKKKKKERRREMQQRGWQKRVDAWRMVAYKKNWLWKKYENSDVGPSERSGGLAIDGWVAAPGSRKGPDSGRIGNKSLVLLFLFFFFFFFWFLFSPFFSLSFHILYHLLFA